MRPLEWWRRVCLLLRRDRAVAELEEEMRLHRDLRAESLRANPAAAADAAIAARIRFGNPLTLLERSRDMWGFDSLDDAGQDLRYAARRLRQRPGFTAAVVVVLALGIGATTAMFSAVDAAMLRPLPFARPQELVSLPLIQVPFDPGPGQRQPAPASHRLDLTDVMAMRAQFSHVAAWASGGLNLSNPDRPQRVTAGVVTADFFNTLGIVAAAGRTFTAEEGMPGAARTVILSHEFWQARYGGKEMLQHTILLNDRAYLVVGIMPRGFSFPRQSDIWIPMSVPITFETFEPFHGFLPSEVVARLAPGVAIDVASQQVLAQWQRGLNSGPGTPKRSSLQRTMENVRRTGAVIPLQRSLIGDRRPALVILLGATGLLLLIACANVTNLLLSQAIARRREMAVREVLGATRGRVIRQLLTESALLALTGALVGVALAPASLGLLRSLLPSDLADVAPARLDLRVLGFAVALGLVTGMLFGLWPAIRTSGPALSETIKSGGGHGSTSGQAGRVRRALVAMELALTVILLVGAGLMLRSFQQLMNTDRGMNTEHAGTLEMAFPATTGFRAARLRVVNPVIERLQATPGVTAAGVVNVLPLGGAGGILLSISVEGIPDRKDDERPGPLQLFASANYFDAMGIPLIAGHTFAVTDDSLSPPVAVINATMAKLYWPGMDPIGRRFDMGGGMVTVIGIVRDVRESRLTEAALPQMYLPITRYAPTNITLVARGSLAPRALLAAMQSAVHDIEPSQAVFHVRTMDEVLSTSVAPRRTNTLLISLFAALAMVLASLGAYAVVSHGVVQRSREFGIRAALGATGGDLIALISREMVWVTGIGLVSGLTGAWVLARMAESLLYGIPIHDAATFVAVPLILLLTVVLATMLPARRALRVNPAEVMRAE